MGIINPMKFLKFISGIFLTISIIAITWGNVVAQSPDTLYFPETGHFVNGPFLRFYQSSRDPNLIYGYPITEQITSKDGRTVQYFERARFELIEADHVQLTPLGVLLYEPHSPMSIDNPSGCEGYPTGFHVCFDFLNFYKSNDGPSQFGNPISPFESYNGLIVQYFEGARFEWHANKDADKRVVISDLGRQYFDQQKEDPVFLRPVSPVDQTIKPVLQLHSRAFVSSAVTLVSGQQSIYVIVRDQLSEPVEAANIEAVVHLSNNVDQLYGFSTNLQGIGRLAFDFSNQKPGELITIDITIDYLGLKTTTRTSFRVWF